MLTSTQVSESSQSGHGGMDQGILSLLAASKQMFIRRQGSLRRSFTDGATRDSSKASREKAIAMVMSQNKGVQNTRKDSGSHSHNDYKISFTETHSAPLLPYLKEPDFICIECEKGIFSDCVTVIKQRWHPHCFLCSECNGTIDANNFRIKNGKVVCHKH